MKLGILATLASGLLYFAAWTGHAWSLAWIAPLPVLWYAFGPSRWWHTAIVAFLAFALGALYFSVIYFGALPVGILITATLGMSFVFTVIVLGSRSVVRRLPGLLAITAFPAMMVTWELISAHFSANGSFGSLAYSQVSFLPLIQIASIAGLSGITFVISLVPSAIAVALRRSGQRLRLIAVTAAFVAAVLIFGVYELQRPAGTRNVKVGLVTSDAFPSAFRTQSPEVATTVITYYLQRVHALAQQGAEVVVLPEEVVALRPKWRDQFRAQLAKAARENNVIVVAGFRRWDDNDALHNVAEIYLPDGGRREYLKQHLIPGLEGGIIPGNAPLTLAQNTGVAICKDMDFPNLGRQYSRAGTGVLFVPAWDFVKDGWLHASMAILRGVEGGYSVARSVRQGLLTATDSHGRLLAAPVSSQSANAALLVSVPVGRGVTVYSRTGDAFGWLCVIAAGCLLLLASIHRIRGSHLRSSAENRDVVAQG